MSQKDYYILCATPAGVLLTILVCIVTSQWVWPDFFNQNTYFSTQYNECSGGKGCVIQKNKTMYCTFQDFKSCRSNAFRVTVPKHTQGEQRRDKSTFHSDTWMKGTQITLSGCVYPAFQWHTSISRVRRGQELCNHYKGKKTHPYSVNRSSIRV